MVLGHARKGLRQIYDAHRYEDQIRDALERWAGRVQALASPAPPTPPAAGDVIDAKAGGAKMNETDKKQLTESDKKKLTRLVRTYGREVILEAAKSIRVPRVRRGRPRNSPVIWEYEDKDNPPSIWDDIDWIDSRTKDLEESVVNVRLPEERRTQAGRQKAVSQESGSHKISPRRTVRKGAARVRTKNQKRTLPLGPSNARSRTAQRGPLGPWVQSKAASQARSRLLIPTGIVSP